MDIPVTQLPPGDPRLVDVIVSQLKSKGIFDQLRKECLSDVDTKPAFLNLRQRVDGQVKKFLGTTTWKNDLNKNHLRDGVRKNIQESGILDAGIDAIINQVITPKIKTLILPYVESTVYTFLQIEKPKREIKEYDIQHQMYIEPPPAYPYGNPVPMSYPPYGNLPPAVFKHEENKLSEEIFSKLPEKVEPVVSSESDISVGGKSPFEHETQVQQIADILPMETDAISSGEDDILSRKSPVATMMAHIEPDVKMDEDNAVDSFDTARGTSDDVVSRVEKMNIKEEFSAVSESVDIKDPEMSKASTGLLFDHQSLDSISSNSSGLSFSPPTLKKQSPHSNNSQDSTEFSIKKSGVELRSTQSTPLIDEKSPLNESINSSDNSKAWAPYTLPKDLSAGEKVTVSSFGTTSSVNDPPAVIGGVSPVSTENSQDSIGARSLEQEASVAHTEESHDSKVKSEKSEGEVTSSNSSLSSEPHKGTSHSKVELSSKDSLSSKREKSKHRSHSRDRDKYRSKDSKRHSRSHSKSKHDDHSSHRNKDKHYRRDKDDDKDRDKHSSSKGHHHRTAVSTMNTSKSANTADESNKDKKDHSTDHHKCHSSSHLKYSSKSLSSKRDSKHEDRHSHSSNSHGKKNDKCDSKSSKLKNELPYSSLKDCSSKSKEKSEISETDKVKDKTNESKHNRILKDDLSFLSQLTCSNKNLTVQKSNKEMLKINETIISEKTDMKKKNNLDTDEKQINKVESNEKLKETEPVSKVKATINKSTKTEEIKQTNEFSGLTVDDGKQLGKESDVVKISKLAVIDNIRYDRNKNLTNKKLKEDSKKKCDSKFNVRSDIKNTTDFEIDNHHSTNKGEIKENMKLNTVPATAKNNRVIEHDNSSSDSQTFHMKFCTKGNMVIQYDNSHCNGLQKRKSSQNKNIIVKGKKNNMLENTKGVKKKLISPKKKPVLRYESSTDSESSSSVDSRSSDSEEPLLKKRKVSTNEPKAKEIVVTESYSSDESNAGVSSVVLKKVTIPVFSFANGDKQQIQSNKSKSEHKNLSFLKGKQLKVPEKECEMLFGFSSDEEEFEGFSVSVSSRPKKVKKRVKPKKHTSAPNNCPFAESDSSDMDISIMQFCMIMAPKLNDFEGFGDDLGARSVNQSTADQKLKRYLSKFTTDSCIELDEFFDAESYEDLASDTVFAPDKGTLNARNQVMDDSSGNPLNNNSIPLVAIEEDSVGSFASDNDSGQSSMGLAKEETAFSETKFLYSVGTIANNDTDDVTVFSNNCEATDVVIQSASDSSIDSISTMSDNYFVPKKQIICNMENILESSKTELSQSPKRKRSETSNTNGISVLPISKKRRILNAVQSEMEENLAKDNVIVNSYSLLTPEEDRTGSKEYEVDLSQRVNAYSPLSPASDSSAEDLKSKNQHIDEVESLHEPSVVKET